MEIQTGVMHVAIKCVIWRINKMSGKIYKLIFADERDENV